jgi:hypothetical protein
MQQGSCAVVFFRQCQPAGYHSTRRPQCKRLPVSAGASDRLVIFISERRASVTVAMAMTAAPRAPQATRPQPQLES